MEGEVVGRKTFWKEMNSGSWPKGCYIQLDGGGELFGIFWNNHPSGSPNMNARQICILGKEERIVNV